MGQAESYISRAHRIAKGGGTDEGSRMDPQVSEPARVGGSAGVRVARWRGELAERRLIEDGPGGSGGPPRPATSSRPAPARQSPEPTGTTFILPSQRRIYSVGSSLFRVWVDEPESSAEFLRRGEWVWTPIPSGSIVDHPMAKELTAEEVETLRVAH